MLKGLHDPFNCSRRFVYILKNLYFSNFVKHPIKITVEPLNLTFGIFVIDQNFHILSFGEAGKHRLLNTIV